MINQSKFCHPKYLEEGRFHHEQPFVLLRALFPTSQNLLQSNLIELFDLFYQLFVEVLIASINMY